MSIKQIFLSCHRSLNARISVLVFGSVCLTMAVIVLFVDNATYKLIFDLESASLFEMAKTGAQTLSDDLEGNVKMAKVAAAQRAIRDAVQTGEDVDGLALSRVKSYLSEYDFLQSMSVLDATGKVLAGATAEGEMQRGADQSSVPEVKDVLAGKKLSISRTASKVDTGKFVYRLAVPVFSHEGKPIGVVLSSVDLGSFSKDHVEAVKLGHTGYAFLIDGDGVIIALGGTTNRVSVDLGELGRTITQKKEGNLEYTWDGVRKVAGIKSVPETG